MADYEPFPTGADERTKGRPLGVAILGCLGCGGLGVVGTLVALALLFGGLATSTSGCEIDVDGDPGKGTASQRLPVDVAPSTGLAEGATVRVTSDAFDPDAIVGIAACLRTADTLRRGVDRCDENQGARFATDSKGRLDATFVVPRVITVEGKAYDCAQAPKRCIVVAASADDYDTSGGEAISFAPGLDPAKVEVVERRPVSDHLPIGSAPTGPVRGGTELTVLATGFQPNEPLLVAHCTDRLDAIGVERACQPDDPADAVSAVALRSLSGIDLHADPNGSVSVKVPACAAIEPFGDDLGKALSATNDQPTGCTPVRPELVHCDTKPGRCSIVIAAAADTKRSAVLPYALAG